MNEYAYTRLEPLVKNEGDLQNVVTGLVVGMTGTNGTHSAYIDTLYSLPAPDPDNFIPFENLGQEWAQQIADAVAEENNFKDSLDKQIEAAGTRPVSKKFAWQQAAAE
tara:strand:+ start:225 stop:548 length:324 start_codon:yes stop_codon:yes gene_type:complete